ncbi:hypothetical protein ACFE04_010313 [Oxalis oulophora]
MCVKDPDQKKEENCCCDDNDNDNQLIKEHTWNNNNNNNNINNNNNTQMENLPLMSSSAGGNSVTLGSISEESVVADDKKTFLNFVPKIRSGEWSDIGGRSHMEDTHVCIGDLANKFGYKMLNEGAISFYGLESFSRRLIIFAYTPPGRLCLPLPNFKRTYESSFLLGLRLGNLPNMSITVLL